MLFWVILPIHLGPPNPQLLPTPLRGYYETLPLEEILQDLTTDSDCDNSQYAKDEDRDNSQSDKNDSSQYLMRMKIERFVASSIQMKVILDWLRWLQ